MGKDKTPKTAADLFVLAWVFVVSAGRAIRGVEDDSDIRAEAEGAANQVKSILKDMDK